MQLSSGGFSYLYIRADRLILLQMSEPILGPGGATARHWQQSGE